MAIRTRLALCLLAAMATGCLSDPDQAASRQFGDTVRHTIALQTASPTATGPGLDAVKSREILKVYRADVAESKKLQDKPLMLNISGGGSSGQ